MEAGGIGIIGGRLERGYQLISMWKTHNNNNDNNNNNDRVKKVIHRELGKKLKFAHKKFSDICTT